MKRSVRLLSLTLLLALLAPTLPTHAAADVAVRALDPPQAGELLDYTASPALDGGYTVDEVCWYRASGDVPAIVDTLCTPGDAAAPGRYLCRVYLDFGDTTPPALGTTGRIGDREALIGQYRGRYFLEAAFTAKPSTRIAAVTLGGIALPTAGASVADCSTVALTVPGGCRVTGVTWAIGATDLAPAITFRAGDALSCTVTVTADEGYRFTDRPTATLCGKAATASIEQSTGRIWRFVFLFTVAGEGQSGAEAIRIGSVDLSGNVPVAGQPASELALTASLGVKVASATLAPADSLLVAGRSYQLTVTLTPEPGYAFPVEARPIVRLNGQSLEVVSHAPETLTAAVTITPYVFPFTDVEAGAWYRETVELAHRLGLINGKSETTYVPGANMNYAEAVKLAACLHQLHSDGRVTLTNGTPWYQSYIDYCREVGILDAAGAKTFAAQAGEAITRAAYVALFVRALPEKALAPINTIPDGAIPDVASDGGDEAEAIYRFYRAGILNGRDALGTFSPTSTINRGEVATIIARLVDASRRVGPPAELKRP